LIGSAGAIVAARRLRIPQPQLAVPRLPPFPSRRALAIALIPVLVAVAAGIGLAATAAPPFRVRALDIGQGDAFLVEAGGKLALVDGGPDPARLLAELGTSLRRGGGASISSC
ncbi:MAG: hypothetical protein M3P16_07750, partial [Chloroflexota bacterium]|nr:hypothetical protein [Chloroflexota bacterium]